MTAQRWSVRVLAIPYYLAIGPFLYDLFVHGVRWRSLYLFLYVILAVAGLQIGYKENDLWVKVWYWTNLPFVIFMTWLAFFSDPFAKFVSLYSWEKWFHLGMLVILTLFYPLRYFIMRKPMTPVGEEEEEEELEEPTPVPQTPPATETPKLQIPTTNFQQTPTPTSPDPSSGRRGTNPQSSLPPPLTPPQAGGEPIPPPLTPPPAGGEPIPNPESPPPSASQEDRGFLKGV